MQAILVVNAGSSSVKFQTFALVSSGDPQRLVKGQIDGIGTRPRLRAVTGEGSPLIDRQYTTGEVDDVRAKIAAAGNWLRQSQTVDLSQWATASLTADRSTTGRW
jgi:acetate kinase